MMYIFSQSRTAVMGAAAIAALSCVGASHAAIQDNLISHYKFDEAASATSAVDAQGRSDLSQNFDGNASGSPLPTSGATGKIGNAWNFESDNSEFLDEADDIWAGASAVTFAGWINPESLAAGTNYTIFSEDSSSAPNKDIVFQIIEEGKLSLLLELGNPTQDNVVTDTAVLSTGSWQHIAFTFLNDGTDGNVDIYVDGAVVKSATVTAENLDSVNDLMVGVLEDSDGSETFDGLLDDFGFWDRNLSAAEIQGIFDSGNLGDDISVAVIVPEPSSMVLAALGGLAMLRRRHA